MERRLLPGAASRFGHDRRDHVDELGLAGRPDAVGVAKQRDQEIADDDGVCHRVIVLEETRRDRPIIGFGLLRRIGVDVPDVPFVEGDADLAIALRGCGDGIDRGPDLVDEAIHVFGADKEFL